MSTNLPAHPEWLLREMKDAEDGHTVSQYSIGRTFREGKRVTQNGPEAVRWLAKASERGYDWAQIALGHMLRDGEGVSSDKPQAALWFRSAADAGNPIAQCELAVMLEDGDGIATNKVDAAEWYRKALRHDLIWADADAVDMGSCRWGLLRLADMLHNGDGIPPNEDEAASYLQRAAKWYDSAARGYGQCSIDPRHDVRGEHAWAQIALGRMLRDGVGVAPDAAKAADCFRKAGNAGNPIALCDLAAIHRRRFVPSWNMPDSDTLLAKAADWLQQHCNPELLPSGNDLMSCLRQTIDLRPTIYDLAHIRRCWTSDHGNRHEGGFYIDEIISYFSSLARGRFIRRN